VKAVQRVLNFNNLTIRKLNLNVLIVVKLAVKESSNNVSSVALKA
jgi:hypothetical protein